MWWFLIAFLFLLFLNNTKRQLRELHSQQRTAVWHTWLEAAGKWQHLWRPCIVIFQKVKVTINTILVASKQLNSIISAIPTCRRESETCLAVVWSGWNCVLAGRWQRWQLAAAAHCKLCVPWEGGQTGANADKQVTTVWMCSVSCYRYLMMEINFWCSYVLVFPDAATRLWGYLLFFCDIHLGEK